MGGGGGVQNEGERSEELLVVSSQQCVGDPL